MPCLRLRWSHQDGVVHRCLGITTTSSTRSKQHSAVSFGESRRCIPPRLSAVCGGGGSEGAVVRKDGGVVPPRSVVAENEEEEEDKEIVSGRVDQWIRDSVEEIVNNIEEAPFLLHIYNNKNKDAGEEDSLSPCRKSSRVVREKARVETWPALKTRWERGSSAVPNGVALVEQLHNASSPSPSPSPSPSSTKVWGIVIQERGVSCPACYILKTSRVKSVSGDCTHFCLFRAECSECVESQLNKLWLLS